MGDLLPVTQANDCRKLRELHRSNLLRETRIVIRLTTGKRRRHRFHKSLE